MSNLNKFDIIKIANKNIGNEWENIIVQYLKLYEDKINKTINDDIKNEIEVYPKPHSLIFNAFKACGIKTIKVVLIAQE